MDLKEFNFPVVTNLDIAFPTFATDKDLLKEAIDRGFYNANTPYNKLFSKIFFMGGKVKFKEDIDETFKQKAWGYCRSLMGSFAPKHEEKEAVCAMLMSEVLEPELAEEGKAEWMEKLKEKLKQ